MIQKFFGRHIDWVLVLATLPLLGAGLVTMNSFISESYFFNRQLIWVALAFVAFFGCAFIDWRFLRRSGVLVTLFFFSCLSLLLLTVVGNRVHGAQSWLSLGSFSIQPADFIKLILILMLAKYFSRRHIEIAYVRHILVSGVYALVPFILILLQPDFGSAIIIFLIWLGMVMFSGISPRHLLAVFTVSLVSFAAFWFFIFAPYQKARIVTFIHPLADIRGAGYNSFQSTIAVGSGQILGKGIGYGTQSRLKFLPEYQTDFIFAAFAEEWGFVGVLLLFILFGLIIWRVILAAMHGATNFETLFGIGLAIMLLSHFTVSVGMNLGLLPVTGLTLPFVSYGGSHLLAEFTGLGILMGMRRYSHGFHRGDIKNEFLGI
ncbi:MAG: rod shape-determining protein RodA [Candidatus Vogelbacteria bacterium]|nr:rod shape-determining protein RodA [Candidatus Vogelbacteria bacterium]